MHFDRKKANRYLPYIVFIGMGIGSANYLMFGELNWIQWIIQSLSTSFLIGYSLVVIAANRSWFEYRIKPLWKLYVMLFVIFFVLGAIASELEDMIRKLLFLNETYHPFSAGKMYVFNGILSLVLGFSFFLNTHFFPGEHSLLEEKLDAMLSSEIEPEKLEQLASINKVPVKQGETIFLIPIQDIVYFEAFDNYSFVYNMKGERKLCDYSLLFLQKRLGGNFLRIHRKYIVNTLHIKQIKPHSNSRYLIQFDTAGLSPIISSKSYTSTIRSLIKIT